ncbi:MAG: hypothetical protein QNJ98_19570 [Planctomycetota bacterium]|nr:hypothetical protein [Planctomycetota bacterium]
MPNGKPGDHPYTDVVLHGIDVFGPPIDDLLRRAAATGGCPEPLRTKLFAHEPRFGKGRDLAALEAALRALLRQRGEDA